MTSGASHTGRGEAAVGGPADLVVRNGRIYTGDPSVGEVSAVAIRDGRVVVVGGDAEVANLVGPATQRVDALGRRVIPGLNDSHLHVIRGGLNYFLELRWDGVRSLRHGLAMLAEQAGRTPPGQWVRVVGGWTSEQFVEQRMPTVAELNAAAPETPVFVLHLYQAALFNRAAVEAIGLTRDSADPPGEPSSAARAGADRPAPRHPGGGHPLLHAGEGADARAGRPGRARPVGSFVSSTGSV